jgi:hypothetical protein
MAPKRREAGEHPDFERPSENVKRPDRSADIGQSMGADRLLLPQRRERQPSLPRLESFERVLYGESISCVEHNLTKQSATRPLFVFAAFSDRDS